jgi:hypothetical protein
MEAPFFILMMLIGMRLIEVPTASADHSPLTPMHGREALLRSHWGLAT